MNDDNFFKNHKKTLVVEDDDEVRDVICSHLGLWGMSYLEAKDGQEAIDILTSMPIAVLVTDFQMPRVNGLELLNWCRTHHMQVPVIFVSAMSEDLIDEQVALKDCCVTIMEKPIDFELLKAAVSAALNRLHHTHSVHGVV